MEHDLPQWGAGAHGMPNRQRLQFERLEIDLQDHLQHRNQEFFPYFTILNLKWMSINNLFLLKKKKKLLKQFTVKLRPT